jgi:hypothetical protein
MLEEKGREAQERQKKAKDEFAQMKNQANKKRESEKKQDIGSHQGEGAEPSREVVRESRREGEGERREAERREAERKGAHAKPLPSSAISLDAASFPPPPSETPSQPVEPNSPKAREAGAGAGDSVIVSHPFSLNPEAEQILVFDFLLFSFNLKM